ncbi:MAG TPA: Mrp/NBP35 family ATP-binding protein [Actinomycetota bacterium]|nr:Mrp/NBP35 family ATP-binding protein [Actinomycetota bacterium]
MGGNVSQASAITERDVHEVLRSVNDPELHRPITELNMVRGVVVAADGIHVSIALTVEGCPLKAKIHHDVTLALRGLGVDQVHVDFTTMTDDQRAELRSQLQGDGAASTSDAFASSRVIAVSSGKGGVGKSSVSTNLALALARRGKRTAIIDADVYGFSIPRMIGIDRKPVIIDRMIVPPEAHGVSVISIGFFANENNPVIWRGPMLHKALTQFVTDVYWDEPDIVIIDMPPGTGDVSLTMAQFLPATEIVVVTTPQLAAQRVAQRAAYMARKVNLTVSGVIENMSWFTGRDGFRYDIFGSGGGQLLAQELGVPLLGQIPLVPALREGSDVGAPILVTQPDSEASRTIDAIAGRLLEMGVRRVRLPVVNIAAPS